MSLFQKHLRNTFLAGIFAAIPVGATIFLVWYVEDVTRAPLQKLFRLNVPFLGIAVAIAVVYLLGLGVTSLVGKWLLRLLDKLLSHVPFLKDLYSAWKQVTVTPGGGEGMYAKVVLVPGEGESLQLAFTSGECVPGDADLCCVFVPNTPNPITGRLMFVRRDCVRATTMTAEEAFKFLISTANYIPAEVGAATCPSPAARESPT
jgi:uncharacterized membrane protein